MASCVLPTSISFRGRGIAHAASLYLAFVVVALIMLSSFGSNFNTNTACDEIYVVGEGETLNTIGDKCADPFIVERNPHIHDPDDVFPGLVIKITPSPGFS